MFYFKSKDLKKNNIILGCLSVDFTKNYVLPPFYSKEAELLPEVDFLKPKAVEIAKKSKNILSNTFTSKNCTQLIVTLRVTKEYIKSKTK